MKSQGNLFAVLALILVCSAPVHPVRAEDGAPAETTFNQTLDSQPPAVPYDPAKEFVMAFLDFFRGRSGDYLVITSGVLMGVSLWRKMFRAAVGFLVVIIGMVFLRMVISLFFG